MTRKALFAATALAALFAADVASAQAARLTPEQRAELRAVAQACRAEIQTHCAGVPRGGGQIAACVQANYSSLSAECQAGVDRLAALRRRAQDAGAGAN